MTQTFQGAAERVARTIDRRSLLKRAAQSAFLTATLIAVEGLKPPQALASPDDCCPTCEYCDCDASNCNPPYGQYCQPSWCTGAHCGSACLPDKSDWHDTGCWCTGDDCYDCGGGASFCGHYRCCDCMSCGPNNVSCGCKAFVYTCPQSLLGVEVPVNGDSNLRVITAHLISQYSPDSVPCC